MQENDVCNQFNFVVLKNGLAILYVNNQKHQSFVVNQRKGKTQSGNIGLWVDIGTIGYFKDLKITKQ